MWRRSVILGHPGCVIAATSLMKSAFTFSPFSNGWRPTGMAFTIVIDLLIVYLPHNG
jgi:hypothetical protein